MNPDHPDIKCLPTRIGIVEMVFEETVHYDLPLNDLSRTEWFALMSPWSHGGFVRLGRDKRAYGVAISHQLHCVVMLGQALANASNPNADIYHVHHCLDYLRQVFLCESDTTLEPGDFELRNYTATPEYNPRTCRDWSAIFGAMEANYKEWEAWYAGKFSYLPIILNNK